MTSSSMGPWSPPPAASTRPSAPALNDSLAMQDALYDQMADKGWYPTQQVEQAKVTAVKQKFSVQAQ